MDYADNALATFENMIGTLQHLVRKAQDAGTGDKVLEAKLADDMFPLETQFRIAINQLILGLGRVYGLELTMDEEPYASLDEVSRQLSAIKDRLAQARETGGASADTPVDFTLPNNMRFVMSSEEYLRDWTMPNFYFHTTMAYALLRRDGLEIGKADFMPHMLRYAKQPITPEP